MQIELGETRQMPLAEDSLADPECWSDRGRVVYSLGELEYSFSSLKDYTLARTTTDHLYLTNILPNRDSVVQ
jgi:hypothetical protein